MMRTLLTIAVFFALFFVWVRYMEQRSLYFPYREIEVTPEASGLDYRDVTLNTPDGQKLRAWFVPRKDSSQVLLFFHGNGGNISHRLEKIRFFHGLGLNVFILDYRGYGASTGRPSEEGLYADAGAAYGYLTRDLRFAAPDVVVFGESLGSAVAVDVASKNKVGFLIVEGAFSSAADMARRIYPFLPAVFLKTRFDSCSKIGRVSVPKLFIHSRNDEIVPYSLGRKLFDNASPPKESIELVGGHNESFMQSQDVLRRKISDFLQKPEGRS